MRRKVYLSALVAVVFLYGLCVPAYTTGIPDCQLPFPVYYVPNGAPGDCTEDVIIEALEIFNDVAQGIGLTYDFFYYAGQTTDTTIPYKNCTNLNGLNQIAWGDCFAGRMFTCAVNEGVESDVIINPDTHICPCEDPMPPDKNGALSSILHELGHVLGMNDLGSPGGPSCPGSIMANAMLGECGPTELADCDIEKLLELYPQYQDDPLEIYNEDVVTSFDPVTYTWDATVTFETTLPSQVKVEYDPQMDCYPACSYSNEQSGSDHYYYVDHTIVLEDLAPSTEYCYKISARANGEGLTWVGCRPTVTGTFELDNGYDEIYDIAHSYVESQGKIKVQWKTKFPSKSNKVYYRKTGEFLWAPAFSSQSDCSAQRFYTASFSAQPNSEYELKVSTKIDGVTYQSDIMTQSTGGGGGIPLPPPVSPIQDISSPFLRAHPNPFNPVTTITFNVPTPSDVQLSIYSPDGRNIRTLVSEPRNKGIYSIEWDAKNHNGVRITSGIYFAKLKVGDNVLTSKLILLK